MSGLQSKFDKISDLRFEPLPTKAVDVVKMVKVGNCTAAADLAIKAIQPGTPTADGLRIHLSGGIRTVIDIIIAVDEFDAEAQPPAAMPLAA